MPLGVGIAGIAGGLALSKRDRRSKVLGVPMPKLSAPKMPKPKMPKLNGFNPSSDNLAEAAKHAGSFAKKASELASEARSTRDALKD